MTVNQGISGNSVVLPRLLTDRDMGQCERSCRHCSVFDSDIWTYVSMICILGLAFASGLAATVTITHLLKSGDEIICMDDVYGGRLLLSFT